VERSVEGWVFGDDGEQLRESGVERRGWMERDGVHWRAVEQEWYNIMLRDENGWRGGGGKVVVECGAEVWE